MSPKVGHYISASLFIGLAILFFCVPFCMVKGQSVGVMDSYTSVSSANYNEASPTSPQAQYPGGLSAWITFLRENARFSQTKNNTRKPIHLAFSVDKHGSIEDIKIIKGKNPEHNKEATRLLKISGIWEPATNNDIPQACKMSIRIFPRNYKN